MIWLTLLFTGLGWLIPVIIVSIFARNVRNQLAKEIPVGDKINEFRDALWKRSTEGSDFPTVVEGLVSYSRGVYDHKNADRVPAYLERVIDRQINKARGILPFNSVIIASLSIERSRLMYSLSKIDSGVPLRGQIETITHNAALLDVFTIIFALGYSSFLCLKLFLVNFGNPKHYENFASEIVATVNIIQSRSYILENGLVISIACIIGAALSVFAIEFGDDVIDLIASIV